MTQSIKGTSVFTHFQSVKKINFPQNNEKPFCGIGRPISETRIHKICLLHKMDQMVCFTLLEALNDMHAELGKFLDLFNKF